jgi:hypothetical protein
MSPPDDFLVFGATYAARPAPKTVCSWRRGGVASLSWLLADRSCGLCSSTHNILVALLLAFA